MIAPDIPDSAVKLKVDHLSGNIRIDEEPLLRALMKLRNYVKVTTENIMTSVRAETESQISETKKELMVYVQEAVAELESEVKTTNDAQTERLIALEGSSKAEDRKTVTRRSLTTESMPAKRVTPRGETDDDEYVMRSKSMLGSQDQNLSTLSENIAIRFDGEEQAQNIGAETDEDAKSSFSHRVSYSPRMSPRVSGMSEVGSYGDAAMQEKLKKVQADLNKDHEALQRLETKMLADIREMTSKLEGLDSERSNMSAKLATCSERVDNAENELRSSSAAMEHLQHEVGVRFKEADTLAHVVQDELKELTGKVAQAALADDIANKINNLSQEVATLSEACRKADIDAAGTASNVDELSSKLNDCAEQLTHMTTQAEVERRCQELDHQFRGVSELLMDVQGSLGDISGAVIALGSKADKSDLVEMRSELRMIAETTKDKEQTVLFGARCLSCNRVFDDVGQNSGTVDLPGERHRDALFSEVQRALHSPKVDPTAKIKMLSVKVGRPTSVPVSGGTFASRDAASFACDVADVQLLPVRGYSMAPDEVLTPSIPEGSPRATRRRPKGMDTWKGGTKEGPLDYKHPLSQLVDRGRGMTAIM
jgi:predicted  nucleic acid-binding Zn-ribbon protein